MNNDRIIDMNGRTIEFGHIVAVRYVWNSYVGVARMKGLCAEGAKRHAFFSPHSYSDKATYQILGHVKKDHRDFHEGVFDWFNSENEIECPVKITIYENAIFYS